MTDSSSSLGPRSTTPCVRVNSDSLRFVVRGRAGRPRSQKSAMQNHPENVAVNRESRADRSRHLGLILVLLLTTTLFAAHPFSGSSIPQEKRRPRAREAGIIVGVLPVGPLNAITDVSGVMVGHATVIRGENVRTGVTAILPHQGNLFREKVPAAIFVGNGFGKLMGSTQVSELGEIETPILLTSTLSPRAADAA